MTGKVAIVGAGPSGCYLAQALRKAQPEAEITIIDRLPVPYGLIRYGVAPDHQGTKAVTRQFARLFEKQNVGFMGNLELGRDLSLAELRATMDAVVVCAGLSADRQFDLPGADLAGIYGAGAVTRYWNGHPDSDGFVPAFGQTVAVMGNGNVAVDILRILAKTEDGFAKSDFNPSHVNDSVQEIHVIGRSPLVHAKFDPVMIRELAGLDGVAFALAEGDALEPAETPNHAALETLLGSVPEAARKRVVFHSGWQATGFDAASGRVGAVRLSRDGVEKRVACDTVVTAIGFAHQGALDRDGLLAAAPDLAGGVLEPGLFAAGWFRRGPTGTIPENRTDAQGVAKSVAAWLGTVTDAKPGRAALVARFGAQITDYDGWKAIDAAETAAAPETRVRAKLSTYASLLDTAKTASTGA